MKSKIVTALLCTTILAPSISQASCVADYEAKLTKIDNKRFIRAVGKYGTTAVVTVGAAAAYTVAVISSMGAAAAVGVGPIVAMGSMLPGGLAYYITNGSMNLLDREDVLQQTYDTLTSLDVTEQELILQYHARKVAQEVLDMNRDRVKIGLPELTDEEVAKVAAATPVGDRGYMPMDTIKWYANKKLDKELSFDEVRLIVKDLNNSKKLCPLKRNGKVKLLSPRQVGKLIAEELE